MELGVLLSFLQVLLLAASFALLFSLQLREHNLASEGPLLF